MAIGLHGGYELAKSDMAIALTSIIWALVLGFVLPIIGYLSLVATRKVNPMDAAAISAHYGSVSAGTFLTAIAYLDNIGVTYESYPMIMLAVMESPAIVVGLLLAAKARRSQSLNNVPSAGAVPSTPVDNASESSFGSLLRDAFTNGSVVILIGSMIIGAISTPSGMSKLFPFIDDIFMGVLCLFLFEMGMVAARRIGDFKKVGLVLAAFGIVMPLVGGVGRGFLSVIQCLTSVLAEQHWLLFWLPVHPILLCHRLCDWPCPKLTPRITLPCLLVLPFLSMCLLVSLCIIA